jgi:hypothetical protein
LDIELGPKSAQFQTRAPQQKTAFFFDRLVGAGGQRSHKRKENDPLAPASFHNPD